MQLYDLQWLLPFGSPTSARYSIQDEHIDFGLTEYRMPLSLPFSIIIIPQPLPQPLPTMRPPSTKPPPSTKHTSNTNLQANQLAPTTWPNTPPPKSPLLTHPTLPNPPTKPPCTPNPTTTNPTPNPPLTSPTAKTLTLPKSPPTPRPTPRPPKPRNSTRKPCSPAGCNRPFSTIHSGDRRSCRTRMTSLDPRRRSIWRVCSGKGIIGSGRGRAVRIGTGPIG